MSQQQAFLITTHCMVVGRAFDPDYKRHEIVDKDGRKTTWHHHNNTITHRHCVTLINGYPQVVKRSTLIKIQDGDAARSAMMSEFDRIDAQERAMREEAEKIAKLVDEAEKLVLAGASIDAAVTHVTKKRRRRASHTQQG